MFSVSFISLLPPSFLVLPTPGGTTKTKLGLVAEVLINRGLLNDRCHLSYCYMKRSLLQDQRAMEFTTCYDLERKYNPKSHVLKTWSQSSRSSH